LQGANGEEVLGAEEG
jgi:hypothetical protein